MSGEIFVHQARLFNPKNARKTVVIGAGSVGSFTALALAKAGIPVELWDDDTIVSYNSPMSLFGPKHVGRYKVDVVAEAVQYLTGTDILVHRKRYEGEPLRNVSVVACVDEMPERRHIWDAVRMNASVDLLCDTRTAATYVEVYCIEVCSRTDIDLYEATLFEAKDAAPQTCGQHGIAFASMDAARVVAGNLTTYWERGQKLWRYAGRSDTLMRAD